MIPDQEDPLEKGLATYARILTWRIPWTRSLGGYSPKGHKESDRTEETEHACAHTHIVTSCIIEFKRKTLMFYILWGKKNFPYQNTSKSHERNRHLIFDLFVKITSH